jgi:predicted site-specific integrase-resolvase
MSYPCARFELNIEPLEEVLDSMSPHPKQSGGREELLDGAISLVTTFAGRLHGMRSAGSRSRLLAESRQCPDGGGR